MLPEATTSPAVDAAWRVLETVLRAACADACRDAVAPLMAKIHQLEKGRAQSRLLTRREAADFLGVSICSIDRMISDGRLVPRRVGRAVRIDQTSLSGPSDVEIAALAREARRAR